MSAPNAREPRGLAGPILLAFSSTALVLGLFGGRRAIEHTQGGAPPRSENAEPLEAMRFAVGDNNTGLVGPLTPLLMTQGVPTRSRQDGSYDHRSLEEMARDWAGEADDPEWTLNVRTFVHAMIETMHVTDSNQGSDLLSIRCRQSVCRLDSDGSDIARLRELLRSAREQGAYVKIRLNNAANSPRIEAYLGKERVSPDSR